MYLLLVLFVTFCPLFYHKQAGAYCRVSVATLNTLAGYIDWVSLTYITSKNCQLLEMLCLLLSEPELQLEAAECLLIAVSRKVSHREHNHDYKILEIRDFSFRKLPLYDLLKYVAIQFVGKLGLSG